MVCSTEIVLHMRLLSKFPFHHRFVHRTVLRHPAAGIRWTGLLLTAQVAVLAGILALFGSKQQAAFAEDAPSAQVVAEVNKVKITKEELQKNMRRHLRAQLAYFRESDHHFLLKRVLEKMVQRELILQEALSAGFAPSDEIVSQYVERLTSELPNGETLEGLLAKKELGRKAFEAGIREDLAVEAYLKQTVYQPLTMSDSEVRERFEADPKSFAAPLEVRARHILIQVAEDADPEEETAARDRIEKVRLLASAEKSNFTELARQYSQGPSNVKGGDLGFFTQNQMDESFAKAAFALEPGQVSEIVRTRFGFHIIKLIERRGGETPAFSDVKQQVAQQLRLEKQRAAFQEHLSALRKRNKVIVYYE